ncbi:hypothetical protein HK102_012902 [Quaeritorhiza haematococci]|nr:hypothetical protein HK102_012902 [Quaeritorhiza haematococci]
MTKRNFYDGDEKDSSDSYDRNTRFRNNNWGNNSSTNGGDAGSASNSKSDAKGKGRLLDCDPFGDREVGKGGKSSGDDSYRGYEGVYGDESADFDHYGTRRFRLGDDGYKERRSRTEYDVECDFQTRGKGRVLEEEWMSSWEGDFEVDVHNGRHDGQNQFSGHLTAAQHPQTRPSETTHSTSTTGSSVIASGPSSATASTSTSSFLPTATTTDSTESRWVDLGNEVFMLLEDAQTRAYKSALAKRKSKAPKRSPPRNSPPDKSEASQELSPVRLPADDRISVNVDDFTDNFGVDIDADELLARKLQEEFDREAVEEVEVLENSEIQPHGRTAVGTSTQSASTSSTYGLAPSSSRDPYRPQHQQRPCQNPPSSSSKSLPSVVDLTSSPRHDTATELTEADELLARELQEQFDREARELHDQQKQDEDLGRELAFLDQAEPHTNDEESEELARQLQAQLEREAEEERLRREEEDRLLAEWLQDEWENEENEEEENKKKREEAEAKTGPIVFRKVIIRNNSEADYEDEDDAEIMQLMIQKFENLLSGENNNGNYLYGNYSGSKVEKVEYVVNEQLHRSFTEKVEEYQSSGRSHKIEIAFHGTAQKNIESILENGFRIGGQNGHPITHGTALGMGVYLGRKPQTSMVYTMGATSMIVVRVVVNHGVDHEDPNVLVARTSAQVLPCYVVHFNNGYNATGGYNPRFAVPFPPRQVVPAPAAVLPPPRPLPTNNPDKTTTSPSQRQAQIRKTKRNEMIQFQPTLCFESTKRPGLAKRTL